MIKIRETDHMEYMDGMDKTDHQIMSRVLEMTNKYEPLVFTSEDVRKVLFQENIGIDGLKVLLSPAAQPYLEDMALRAKQETAKHFGNTVCMFTPLYIANYCENYCVYCGFNCSNKINRGKLSMSEIESEFRAIAETGLREILLLTGESKTASPVSYIADAVRLAKKYFSTIGIEVYPMNVDEYAAIKEAGADFVSVYQETYDPKRYEEVQGISISFQFSGKGNFRRYARRFFWITSGIR